MTMQHQTHPDDERLAALAGDDPEVASDAPLRAHVDSCDRCGEVVRELGSLRAALAELPDLVPSRPLQLLPPVAEPKAARGGWLRRLAGPAMAAGFVLVVVGAIGSSGFSLSMGSAGAAPVQQDLGGAAPSAAAGEGGSESTSSDSERPTAPGVLDGHGATSRAAASGDAAASSWNVYSFGATTQPEVAPPVNPGDNGGGTSELFQPTDPRLPWLVVLALGVGLLFAGIYLRFAQQPRAG
jgi:hypothetical protein